MQEAECHVNQFSSRCCELGTKSCVVCHDVHRLPFQERVSPWMHECFGPNISNDKVERNHRFLEEALELVQSLECTKEEAYLLVDYVYGRPVGEPGQEVGGVMVTLAALCLAQRLHMHLEGETELTRIWTKVEQIRAKQAAKPRNSPLPQATEFHYVPVPRIPTEKQWDGLARDIIMWMDMSTRKTPKSLLQHLTNLGVEAPQWLLDEPEMKNLDHVISKGTRATIIYRAMIEATTCC